MRRVTFLITGLAVGGAESQAVKLMTRLVDRGWSISVISMLTPAAYQKVLCDSGVEIISLHMRRGVPDPRALIAACKALARLRPDIVHCHEVHGNLLGRLCRMFIPVPVLICSAHSINEGPKWRDYAYRM